MKRFENLLKLAASLSAPLWSATNTVDGGKADWAELHPIEIDPEADTLPHSSEDRLSIRFTNDVTTCTSCWTTRAIRPHPLC